MRGDREKIYINYDVDIKITASSSSSSASTDRRWPLDPSSGTQQRMAAAGIPHKQPHSDSITTI
jgi:hypothetical protein